jgi:hypothetical protein
VIPLDSNLIPSSCKLPISVGMLPVRKFAASDRYATKETVAELDAGETDERSNKHEEAPQRMILTQRGKGPNFGWESAT